MKNIEWITDGVFFDEDGRLHITNPAAIRRIKSMGEPASITEINPKSVVVEFMHMPPRINPSCPDGLCVCIKGKIEMGSPVEKQPLVRTKAVTTTRARKPSARP